MPCSFRPLHRVCELARAVRGLERRDDVAQAVAFEHFLVRGVETDAVVGHAVLRRVVGADLLGTVARADLCQTLGALGSLLLGEHLLVEASAKDGHRRDLVLQLGLLILRLHDQAGRQVRDAHGGVGRVDALAARAAGAVRSALAGVASASFARVSAGSQTAIVVRLLTTRPMLAHSWEIFMNGAIHIDEAE